MAKFRRYTWWKSTKSKRLFVIVEIWWESVGTVSFIDLLELGETKPIRISPVELELLIEKKNLEEIVIKGE